MADVADRGRWDAIVIGSGFGGSSAALELAESGLDVLLIERGMPYPPGSFPRTPGAMRRNFWDPSAGLHGLFELWSFRHVRAVVASGLGGGSLIYANVLLRKPADTFDADDANGQLRWPVDVAALQDRYAAAERRLGKSTIPESYIDVAGGSDAAARDAVLVPKTRQFMASARAAGLNPELAPVAISFRPPGSPDAGAATPGLEFDHGGDNVHGRPRRTCSLIGECDLGCNQGAKNTLDYTHLGAFQSVGGTIFSCCEATSVRPAGGGYRVDWVEHRAARGQARRHGDPDRTGRLLDPESDDEQATWARVAWAPVVVVSAGTFGSTRLLLRSRPWLPGLSGQLGRRFSTNGDLLTFARHCFGRDGRPRDLRPSAGPVITATAEQRTDRHRLWMQDAGGPSLTEWLWQATELPRDLWAARALAPSLLRGRGGGRISALAARSLGTTSASCAMLPMLTMGRDISGGRLRLQDDGLELDWDPNGPSAGHFTQAQRLAAAIAGGLGGRLSPRGFARLARGLTAHPLGGCPMGESADTGVVDASGEVFGHRGLFVCDGSIMPGPVGPNPSLTIAALGAHIGEAARRRAEAARSP